ncbi:alpha/beta hydrolase [Dokdonella sp.]|uniref:alpha/beta hydrolase n=1 Tax=Dokdonella sp. TaxID=2291710 RepID=UPI003529152B
MRSKPGLFALAMLCGALVAACAAGGDVSKPIPRSLVSAPQVANRLVVVLPGRGEDVARLEDKGMAATIQATWPDADVLLTGLTLPFYRQGLAASRLQTEIIEPARSRGVSEIWLLGISLGGMGAILHEHEYPGTVDGIVLLSPYLGGRLVQDEIRSAGSIADWNPGPVQPLGPDTFERELWRTIQQWNNDASRRNAVWLAYGEHEDFRESNELMGQALPASNVRMLPGGHDWNLWLPATTMLLETAENVH